MSTMHRLFDDLPARKRARGFRRVAGAFLLATLAVQSQAQAQMIADEEIVAAIEREFLHDDVVPFNRIDAHSEDGIVTLSGHVPDLAARAQAEALAGIVKGVRSVVNRLEVTPTTRLPSAIAAGVRDALETDPATDDYEIAVQVNPGGRVVLSGTTDSWAERSLAEAVAATVSGVTGVENQLTVDTSRVYRGAGEISDEIEQRMTWDVRIDDSLITVLTRDGGRVVLSGTVGSLAEKRHAEELARVHGVTDVDASRLEVERWARDEDLRRGKYEELSDDKIETALRSALSYDPRVLEAPITIRVEDGNVWLRGAVDSVAARAAAERDAMNTVGVRRVFNHLKVRSELLTDDAIAQLIANTLQGRGLDEDELQISVTDGRARLTGDVDSLIDYWRIDQTASTIRGVEELSNELTVRSQIPRLTTNGFGYFPHGETQDLGPEFISPGYEPKTDRELYDDVASELFWSPFVDHEDIDVEVEDGVATLRGTVGSRREARAARDNAYQAGARSVRSNLIVQTE